MSAELTQKPVQSQSKNLTLSQPTAGIITGFGINADQELALAFEMAGARVHKVHASNVFENPSMIKEWQIAAFPGGFSYGDHIGSGQVLAHQVKVRLGEELQRLVERDGLIIGICNGFQTLVKSGILPNLLGNRKPDVSLIHNAQGAFIDTWISLDVNQNNSSPWLTVLKTNHQQKIEYPIRHGEGRFIFGSEQSRQEILSHEQIAFRYKENPNGSQDHVAGITDRTGKILGLMPHPEAFLTSYRHPRWTREPIQEPTAGLGLFLGGVGYFR
jgi:phosphoribosylformylglycinamidine (FGAM) synthase-like amidotransferase family enzyme